MDAVNTYKVFNWLWTSGQLAEGDITELPGLGFDTVINLATPDSTKALKNEAELVTSLHLNYVQIPVEWELPEVDQFFLWTKLMQALDGHKVWVHCIMNMRVSAFIYLYRKYFMSETEEQARSLMDKIWTPNDIWQKYIEEISKQLSN